MSTDDVRDFTLQHIEGHPVRLSDHRGKRAVVMFAAKDTAKQAKQASVTIRQRYDHEELPILLVIDLSGLPKVLQRVAKSLLKKGYQEAVTTAKADYAAAGKRFPEAASEAVIMLPDPDGSVTASFGVGDVNAAATAVLVDEEGRVVGRASGPDAGDHILKLHE